jgi:hypothetical protein
MITTPQELSKRVLVEYTVSSKLKLLSNEDVRNLLIEIKEIGRKRAPALTPKSVVMKQLFKLSKRDYVFWSDRYYYIAKAIEREILNRVLDNTWQIC